MSDTTIRQLMLSPRGYYDIDKKGFRICGACHTSLKGHHKPRFAISNGFAIGQAPNCLRDLNPAELALLSLSRIDKHIFTYFAGCHQSIKGWHSMFETDIGNMQQASRFVANKLRRKTIAVLLCGPFTSYQKRKVEHCQTVRLDALNAGLAFLRTNNTLYRSIEPLSEDNVVQPILIDSSTDVPTMDRNIKDVLEYTVVFPDAEEVIPSNGGHDTQHDFTDAMIDSLGSSANSIFVEARPSQRRLRDYEDDNLLRAFPLQFPYGIGVRPTVGEGRNQKPMSIDAYVRHLIGLSNPDLHRGPFLLVLFNMWCRSRAARVSSLRCHLSHNQDTLGDAIGDMSVDDLQEAYNRRENNDYTNAAVGDRFLSAIHAVSKSLPHSNEASVSAQTLAFSLVSYFGFPSLMLTFTPFDDNMRVKVHSMNTKNACGAGLPPQFYDDGSVIADFINDLSSVRQEYPGLCAMDYEIVKDLIVLHVIGWDVDKNAPSSTGGVFGPILAYSISTEEQGRKTLHGHALVTLAAWSSLLQRLYNNDDSIRDAAATELKIFVDNIVKTRFHFDDPEEMNVPHTCVDGEASTSETCVRSMVHCTKQDLRNLRYKLGLTSIGGKNTLKCGICQQVFKPLDIFESNLEKLDAVLNRRDGHLENRLVALSVRRNMQLDVGRYVGSRVEQHKLIPKCIHYTRNLHAVEHTDSCFKNKCSCRMRQPMHPADETKVLFLEKPVHWYSWRGINDPRRQFQIQLKRHVYDWFMNSYSPIVSESLGCNSNVTCGLDGAAIMYVTMYPHKKTQKEDKSRYLEVVRCVINAINRDLQADSLKENITNDVSNDEVDDNEESKIPLRRGHRRLLGAVLVNTKSHIISSPMARYLISNESRFQFSHKFAFLPAVNYHPDKHNEYLGARHLASTGSVVHFFNGMIDYLLRPCSLENMCCYEMVSLYTRRPTKSDTHSDKLAFKSDHPSYKTHHMVIRDFRFIPILTFHDFESVASFCGYDILEVSKNTCPVDVWIKMENYARVVLQVFLPFRTPSDLCSVETSFVLTLRHSIEQNKILPKHLLILQNIQDCRTNLNTPSPPDLLDAVTIEPVEFAGLSTKDKNGISEEELDALMEHESATLAALFEPNHVPADESTEDTTYLNDLSLDSLVSYGSNNCGSTCIRNPPCDTEKAVYSVSDNVDEELPSIPEAPGDVTNAAMSYPTVTRIALNTIRIRNVRQRVSTDPNDAGLPCPNGSIASLREWGRIKFGDDVKQRRAFEVITSSFILSFYDEANQLPLLGHPTEQSFQDAMDALRIMQGLHNDDNDDQLIMFLTGPAGAGKSHVFKTLRLYAMGFCTILEYPFDRYTIVFAAMSGTAASDINGSTLHRAISYYWNVLAKDIKNYEKTRLFLLDEISMADCADIRKLHSKLGELKEQPASKFGGIHIVFSGDFRQLEKVKCKLPLYCAKNFNEWHSWMNSFIQLEGLHRFSSDVEWGRIMQRFHKGVPTDDDFDVMDSRVVRSSGPNPTLDDIPDSCHYAVQANKDRAAINNGVFRSHLETTHDNNTNTAENHTILIRASGVSWKKGKKKGVPFSAASLRAFYENCSDHCCRTCDRQKTFSDPMLKMYFRCPMMHLRNTDVHNAIANGTLGYLLDVCLKPGVTPSTMKLDGRTVYVVDADDVEYIELEFENKEDRPFPTFKVYPERQLHSVAFPPGTMSHLFDQIGTLRASVYFTQFQILNNSATTGHKLQGKTKDSLFVAKWSYDKNWPYVVMSRVTTMNGFFSRHPLKRNADYSVDDDLALMLQHFHENISPANHDFA